MDEESTSFMGWSIKDKRNGTGEYKEKNELAVDQLLNALYLRLKGDNKIDFSKTAILNNSVLHNLEGN